MRRFPRAVLVAALAAIALSPGARAANPQPAQVIICPTAKAGGTWESCTATAIATAKKTTDLTFWCDGNATIGGARTTCPAAGAKWILEGQLATWTKVLTADRGWQKWEDIIISAAPPPTCSAPKPPDETRSQACAAPTIGSWTQTRTYSCSAPNWTASAWTPATAPPGVCTTPPASGVFTALALDATTGTPGKTYTVSWIFTNPAATCRSNWAASVPTSGSAQVTPTEPAEGLHDFTIHCDDAQSHDAVVTVFIYLPPLPARQDADGVPACFPFPLSSAVSHAGDSSEGTSVGFWFCESPTWAAGYYGADNSVAATCVTDWSITLDNARRQWKQCVNRAATAAEKTAVDALSLRWTPRFTVAGAGQVPIYSRNPDGTLGPQVYRHGQPLTATAGLPCSKDFRVTVGAKIYQRVAAKQLVSDADFAPQNSFVECTRAAPPANGFP